MAGDGDKTPNFWSTLPGLLAGFAALIAAVTGLIAIFHPTPPLSDIHTSSSGASEMALGSTNTSSAASATPSSQTDQPPDKSGSGETPLFELKGERIAIWRVHDSNRSQLGIYFRNAGTKMINVRFEGNCLQPGCKPETFPVPPISRDSGPANDTTLPCASDAHFVFDTLNDFDFTWSVWVSEETATPAGC